MRPFGGGHAPQVDTRGLPPGPRWPAWAQSVALLRFRHRFVPWLHRRYGDAFTVRILPAGRPLVLFTRPEHAKEIFAGDPAVFHAGKGNAILGPIMGEHSLLLQDGAEHQRARKLLMPAFNGQALQGYGALVDRVAGAEVGPVALGRDVRGPRPDERAHPRGHPAVVFGVTDEARLAALRPRVKATVDVSPAVLLGWGLPVAAAGSGCGSAPSTTRWSSTASSTAEIRERRTAPDLADRTDVLSRLIRVEDEGDGLTDAELRDQLVTLLLAGHETTATALAWALYELGRDPAQLASCAGGRGVGRRRLARGGGQGVDAAAPGDPDGGADPDGARHRRRLRPAGRHHRRALDPPGAPAARVLPRARAVRPGAVRRAGTPPRTPGSRSVAASAAASVRASR